VTDLLEQVWPVFVAETREQVQALGAGILELEASPRSGTASALRRLAHSLKGSAASLGIHDVERAAHAIEDLLALAEGPRGLPGGAVEALLRATRAVEESLEADTPGRITDLPALLAQVDHLAGRRAAAAEAAPVAAGPGRLAELVRLVGSLCLSDGEARTRLAGEVRSAAEELAAALRGAPAELAGQLARAAAALEEGREEAPRAIAGAAKALVDLQAALDHPPAPAGAPADQDSAAPAAPLERRRSEGRSIRIDAARLDAVSGDVDQLVVGVSRRERRSRDLQRHERSLKETLRLLTQGVAEARLPDGARPRALDDGLERLRSLGVELAQGAREGRRESDRERLLAHGLRSTLQALRMVPAEAALAALPPTVRELAAQLGKQVALRLVGGEVRLDRRVLDELKAPLLHLVRNALDHGIEAPADRRAAGKPEQALLEVRVEPRGDRVRLVVRDDGAGLSPERVRAAAVQRGVIGAEEAGRLPDAEAVRLAFLPGVSTARTVTAVSGRGVGLDVVAEVVRRLGGSVDVTFEAGRGSAFVLDVPVAVAATTGLLFRAGGGAGLIPADAVERVLLVETKDLVSCAGQVSLSVEGEAVPYLGLAQVLGAADGPPGGGTSVALLVAAGGKRAALAVDEVLGDAAIIVTPLGRRLATAPHVAGAAVLEDGRVVAVLNPAQLVGRVRRAPAAGAVPRARIVVADDSLSTRAATKTLLEVAGYRVVPAADGEEALALARQWGCDLVVSDVQMPRLDGLELTRRLRADQRLAQVPVILVTSLGSPEDRAAGLEAGASGYLVKRDLLRGRLLELVRQLLPP